MAASEGLGIQTGTHRLLGCVAGRYTGVAGTEGPWRCGGTGGSVMLLRVCISWLTQKILRASEAEEYGSRCKEQLC